MDKIKADAQEKGDLGIVAEVGRKHIARHVSLEHRSK